MSDLKQYLTINILYPGVAGREVRILHPINDRAKDLNEAGFQNDLGKLILKSYHVRAEIRTSNFPIPGYDVFQDVNTDGAYFILQIADKNRDK